MVGNQLNTHKQKQNEHSVSLTQSFRGYEFNPSSDKWKLDRNKTLNLGFLSSLNINRELVSDIREVIQYFAESYSSGYTVNFGDSLKSFFKETNAISITEDALLHFKGKYSLKKDEPKIALIRTFVRQMRYMQLDSQVEEGVFELFDKWRLSGGHRGVPVLSLDPISGPFSDIEFEAIGSQAAAMYAEGTITLVQYALILLFKATGRRPEQIASLKILDFVFTRKHTKSEVYAINIPRIKQDNSVFRGAFKMFGLIDSTGQVLTEYLKQHIKHVQEATGRKLTKAQIANLPLFINDIGLETLKDAPNKGLISLMHTEVLHMTSINIGKRLKKAVGELQVTSERTGEVIHVNAYRFRYTVGTRAAREGAGELTIANVLDHSDTQHTGVYVKNVPEFALNISIIMNQSLMPYAKAFAGKVVKNESEANKETPNATRIPCHEKDCDVGSCGTSAFCTDYAPVACYLCRKFRPWAEAPHYLVLEWLIDERDRLIKESGDMTIVAVNDRAIIAVKQVMDKCQEFNANV